MDIVVRTQGLHKRYGRTIAVRSLDLSVPKGAVFGLLGPNGAGKTTTFGILCGWLKATAGSAQVLGLECRHLYKLRGKVAVLPQDAAFPPQISVVAQLTHYGRLMGLDGAAARKEAERTLEAVGLSDSRARTGSQLSHGMLKRVGLAQTMVGNPEVIFLDEPTSGLDPKSARQVKDLIASLAPRATVILSSHNLVDVQEICTHGAILNRGDLAMAGSIEELTRRGAEITIDVRGPTDAVWSALEGAFGKDNVSRKGDEVRILFASERDVAEVIAQAVRLMLDKNVPLLGVRRGTSLETAFLEVTKDGAPARAQAAAG